MSYRSYRVNQRIKSTGVVEKVPGEEVPEGHVLEVTQMVVANEARADMLLELGYVDGVGVDRILTLNDGTNRFECHLSGRAWIEEGETPFGRVTTPTDGDFIVFSCHGKLWPKG